MPQLRAISLDFNRAPGYAMPCDRQLHQLAVEFAKKELAAIPDYSSFARVWVAAEIGAEDKPVSIEGALTPITSPKAMRARKF